MGPVKPLGVEVLRADGIRASPAVDAASFLDRWAVDLRCARNRLKPPVLEGIPYPPLAGVPGVRTILCEEDDGWLSLDSDAWGVNNPGRTPQGADLLIVGDSYVRGFCVPPEPRSSTRCSSAATRCTGSSSVALARSSPSDSSRSMRST